MIGLPVTARIDRAAPPRPSPSIRVSTTPETPILSSNSVATLHRVLTGQAVNDQQRFARGGDIAHRRLRPSALRRCAAALRCRAYRRHSRPAVACCLARLAMSTGLALDDGQGINADLGAEDRKLFHRRRAVHVERGHQHPLAVLFLQPLGELSRWSWSYRSPAGRPSGSARAGSIELSGVPSSPVIPGKHMLTSSS